MKHTADLPPALCCCAGEEAVAASPGGAAAAVAPVGRQTFFEAMRSFLLQHFLSDTEMTAEMHAGRGAAHYDMDEYTVSLLT